MNNPSRFAFLRDGDQFRGARRFLVGRKSLFDNPYLELLGLLAEAAGIEHSLMIAYLFAMFSIKDQYKSVRGVIKPSLFMQHRTGGQPAVASRKDVRNYLAICTEEMQHLSLVNGLLGELGAAPNLMPHQFPLPADIYPFEIDLESLSREVVAKYLWIEADDVALNPDAPEHTGDPEEQAFILEVLNVLRIPPKQSQHVGSIYRQIIDCFETVWKQRRLHRLPDDFPYSAWRDRLRALQFQGEITHYTFFKDQFTGKLFGANIGYLETPGERRISRQASYPRHRLPGLSRYDSE